MSQLGKGPFWVSDQGTNLATLYNVIGATNVSLAPLVVSIPTAAGPTGQVSNANLTSFQVDGSHAVFIFVTLDGTIAAWNPSLGTSATVQKETPGAVYTGLGINTAQNELYAANFAGGRIDVFDDMFAPVALLPGAFATPAAIATSGFRPFNVQDLGGTVFVTYAPPDDDEATAGEGAMAEFTEDGALITTIVGGPLASPWGLAWAPAGFGEFGGDLLIANESAADPGINAYDPVSRTFALGSISIDPGAGNEVGAIWGISFGFGNNGGDPNTLYFVDGLNDERNGLFGAITAPGAPVPELPTWAMLLAGFGGLGLAGCRKARRKGA
jgi:uncharacterized protein (TIGR03118 family)